MYIQILSVHQTLRSSNYMCIQDWLVRLSVEMYIQVLSVHQTLRSNQLHVYTGVVSKV